MKKLILSFFSIVLFISNSTAQMHIGGELGLNMSNMTLSPPPIAAPTPVYGARFGALADYTYLDNWSLQTGLFFSMMGFGSPASTDSIAIGIESRGAGSTRLYYVHIPINVVFSMGVGHGKLFVAAGPYVGYGLSGAIKTGTLTNALGDVAGENRGVKFGSDSISDYKRLDIGLSASIAYELHSGLFFRAGYDLGLTDLSTQTVLAQVNTCAHLSVGYYFTQIHFFDRKPKPHKDAPTADSSAAVASTDSTAHSAATDSTNHTVSGDSTKVVVPADSISHAGSTDSVKQVVPVDSTKGIVPADSTKHATPTDSSGHIIPIDSTKTSVPADSTNHIVPTDSTGHFAPTDSTKVSIPADSDSANHVVPPDGTNHVAPLGDSTKPVVPVDNTNHIAPIDSAKHAVPIDSTNHIVPADSTAH